MSKVIKASGIEISRNDKGELLLRMNFRDLNTEEEKIYSWMPQWEAIRALLFSAIVVESMNSPNSQELGTFKECLELCLKVRHNLIGMLSGNFGKED